MSTKTLRKRTALVAVTALGAGLLSVVAAPSANAAEGDTTYNASTLLVGTSAPTVSTNVGTATLAVGGTITLTMATAASHAGLFTVTGGTVVSASSESGGSVISSAISARQLTDNKTITATFQASAAGTNMVIKSYADWEDSAAVDTWTVTVVATGVSGVFSAAKSLISIVDDNSTSAAAADVAYANIVANADTGVISYTMKDGLDNNLAATTVVYASVASGGCVIGLADAPTAGRIVVGVSPSDLLYVAQSAAFEDLATTCVIDIEVAGTKVASKTFIFQGAVASINVTAPGRGAQSATNTGMAYITAHDAAGNAIAGVTLTGAIVNAADGTVVSSVTMSNSGVTESDADSINAGTSPAAVPATIGWVCTAVKGSVPVRFSTPNGTGGFIYSATFNAVCAGNPATYTASFDKASYVPGDIATLTITAKDSAGALTNDAATLGTATTAEIAIAGSNLTAVAAPTNADTFTDGVKTIKYIVGSTEGSYQLSLNLPKWNSSTYSQSAIAVPYSIKATSGAVSNADVLKAIVSLIASINKQIAALQKALLKKK
jgi:trimeric autotransporter adhesin